MFIKRLTVAVGGLAALVTALASLTDGGQKLFKLISDVWIEHPADSDNQETKDDAFPVSWKRIPCFVYSGPATEYHAVATGDKLCNINGDTLMEVLRIEEDKIFYTSSGKTLKCSKSSNRCLIPAKRDASFSLSEVRQEYEIRAMLVFEPR